MYRGRATQTRVVSIGPVHEPSSTATLFLVEEVGEGLVELAIF
jgi:hypothetical protein